MWLIAALLACPVATEADLADVRDGDGDGIAAEAFAGNDCDDDDPDVYPGADDAPYDGIDSDCRGDDDFDADGDGVRSARDDDPSTPADCDDDDPTVGAADQVAWLDADGDGVGAGEELLVCPDAEGVASSDGDCNDSDAGVRPGAAEIWYDGIDQDCDGNDDDQDGDGVPLAADCDDTDAALTAEQPWYPDDDGDGFGAMGSDAELACVQPAGMAATDDDCDDSAALVNPAEVERCDDDDVDEDCSGVADDLDSGVVGPFATFYEDEDGDGFGTDVTVEACDAPDGFAAETGDCADDPSDASILPFTAEQLHPETAWYVDQDLDGYGDPDGFTGRITCDPQDFLAPRAEDCNDRDPAAFPGADDPVMEILSTPSATRIADEDCAGDTDLPTVTYDGIDWPDHATSVLEGGCTDPVDVWVVAEDGSGDFTEIQPALDAANACDRVQIHTGTYAPFVVSDSVVVAAYPGEEVVIEGGPAQLVGVSVLADLVVLEGLTIRGFEVGVYVAGISILEWLTVEGGTVGLDAAADQVVVFGGSFRDLIAPVINNGSTKLRISEAVFEDNDAAGGILGELSDDEGARSALHLYRSRFQRNATTEGSILGAFDELFVRNVSFSDSAGAVISVGALRNATLVNLSIEEIVTTTTLISLGAGLEAEAAVLDRIDANDCLWTPGATVVDPAFIAAVGFVETTVQRVDLTGNTQFGDGGAPWLGVFLYDLLGLFEMDNTLRHIAIAANGGTGLMMTSGQVDNITLVGLDHAIQPLATGLNTGPVVVRNSILWDNEALVREETSLLALLYLLSSNGTVEVEDSLVYPGDPDAPCLDCMSSPAPGFLRYDPSLPTPMWNLRLLPTSNHLSRTPIPEDDWPCSGADPNGSVYDPRAIEDQLGAFGNRGLAVDDYTGAIASEYSSCWPPDYVEPVVMYNTWRQANVAHVPDDDEDLDGLTTKEEFDLGTLPSVDDTDGDGVDDLADAAPLDVFTY